MPPGKVPEPTESGTQRKRLSSGSRGAGGYESAMPFVVAGPAGGLFCLVSEATEQANNFLPAIN